MLSVPHLSPFSGVLSLTFFANGWLPALLGEEWPFDAVALYLSKQEISVCISLQEQHHEIG